MSMGGKVLGVLDSKGQNGDNRYRELVTLVLAFALLSVLYFVNLDGWLIEDDEGTFLYQTWRISLGEVPYRDFMSSHWPLFLYTGGGWMRLFGAEVLSMRLLSAITMLACGILVYCLANEYTSGYAALMSMTIYLLHPEILRYGRIFQTESFYLFFGILGVWFFTRGLKKSNSYLIILSGISFAIATLYKQLAVYFMAGCFLWIIKNWYENGKDYKRTIILGIRLFVPYSVVLGSSLLIAYLMIPESWYCLFGLQFTQGIELKWFQILIQNSSILIGYFLGYSVFILIAFSRYVNKNEHSVGLMWQLIPIISLLFIRRDIFTRNFIYVVPSLAILCGISLHRFRQSPYPRYLYVLFLAMLLLPWTASLNTTIALKETDTQEIVNFVEQYLSESQLLVSDYQEINFYTKRASTYTGAEISGVFTSGNAITSEDIITQIEEDDVKMVLVDSAGFHLASLQDYDKLEKFLLDKFTLIQTIERRWQNIQVYYRQ